MTIRLILADDEKMTLRALSDLLAMEDDLEVVAEANNAQEVLHLADQLTPDVCVLDLGTPGKDGITVAEKLRQDQRAVRCIIVTSDAKQGHLQQALQSGVSAYVPKSTSAEDLALVIRTVHTGRRFVDPNSLSDAILATEDCPLTEMEVRLLSSAESNSTFERAVWHANLAPKVAGDHLSLIVAKLQAKSLREAIYIARQHNWI